MKLLLALSFFIQTFHVFSQAKHDYVWLFGTTAPDTTLADGNIILNFNDGNLKIKRQILDVYFYVTNASISDENGKLLFYTNGCYLSDASHNVMENGEELNPGIFYDLRCPEKGYTTTRGAIILPKPGSSDKFYMFYIGGTIGVAAPFFGYADRLQYASVDMDLNNGLGAVTEKNQIIIQDSLFDGALTAVRHANNQDWWVIVPKAHENKYFKVLLTVNGVDNISEQKIGINPDPWMSGGAEGCFSPDGTKYAWYNSTDNVLLFDFDRATGELSNFQQLFADTSDAYRGGLSISSNSRYLYVTTRTKLWQFDLQASDIQASKILVGEFDGYLHGSVPVTFYHMQLGPDCRIYMIPTNGVPFLHVIHHPDRPGLECGFDQRGIKLPATNAISLPNFPHYRLGTPYPICDSTIAFATTPTVVVPSRTPIEVYPNPAWEEVTVELSVPLILDVEFVLYSQLGQLMLQEIIQAGQTRESLSVDGVSPGLYFWQVKASGTLVKSGKIIISK